MSKDEVHSVSSQELTSEFSLLEVQRAREEDVEPVVRPESSSESTLSVVSAPPVIPATTYREARSLSHRVLPFKSDPFWPSATVMEPPMTLCDFPSTRSSTSILSTSSLSTGEDNNSFSWLFEENTAELNSLISFHCPWERSYPVGELNLGETPPTDDVYSDWPNTSEMSSFYFANSDKPAVVFSTTGNSFLDGIVDEMWNCKWEIEAPISDEPSAQLSSPAVPLVFVAESKSFPLITQPKRYFSFSDLDRVDGRFIDWIKFKETKDPFKMQISKKSISRERYIGLPLMVSTPKPQSVLLKITSGGCASTAFEDKCYTKATQEVKNENILPSSELKEDRSSAVSTPLKYDPLSELDEFGWFLNKQRAGKAAIGHEENDETVEETRAARELSSMGDDGAI